MTCLIMDYYHVKYFCMIVRSSARHGPAFRRLTIIGLMAQQNYVIGYDLENLRLSMKLSDLSRSDRWNKVVVVFNKMLSLCFGLAYLVNEVFTVCCFCFMPQCRPLYAFDNLHKNEIRLKNDASLKF